MSIKFFLLLFYVNESTMEIQLGHYCYSSLSHINFWIWKAWFKIFIEVWFWLYGVALMAKDNLLRKAKRNSNSNGKQEANNKKFKVFCGSCDLEITSRKNGISNDTDFCVMILKALLPMTFKE